MGEAAPVGVEFPRDERVALVRISQAEGRNVLDPPLLAALRESLDLVRRSSSVRCVVLTGSERAFAAGADLGEIEANSTAQNLAYNRDLRSATEAVAALEVPSIAAVNAHAIGGGLELALACTLRIVASEARLGLPEVRLGILPGTGGLARLPRLISPSAAARLLLTGDLIGGEEATALGLADVVTDADSVLTEALGLAERIAAAAPLSVRAITASLREDAGLSIADANARAEVRLAGLLDSNDRREGARAFLERREPSFGGD